MTEVIIAPYLGAALKSFKEIVADHAEKDGREGRKLVVFCEDRLSLVAERAVCEEAGGTFAVSVYTFSRFLSAEAGRCDNLLTSQGAAMAISRLIEKNRDKLKLFNRLSSASAAQDVYDTIALLYSSKISPSDLSSVTAENTLLSRKLSDLGLLYSEYSAYLNESGSVDMNAYLRRLPSVIAKSEKLSGADIVLLGYQAFTSSVADVVKACLKTAGNVSGIFLGGAENKYVNEAWAAFEGLAKECGRKVIRRVIPSELCPAAERLRKHIFEPESFHTAERLDIPRGQITIAEAVDEEDECALYAATILKAVEEDGVRYRDISVMLPDLNAYQPVLERVFEEYGIPYYVDRRYPLSSHSVCEFILNYLNCAADGCRQQSVIAAVSSPLFTFKSGDGRGDKDIFVNYMLRAVSARGGVKKTVNPDICRSEAGLDAKRAERVRQTFIEGLKLLPTGKAVGERFADGVRNLLKFFGCEKRLAEMAEEAENCGFASIGSMSARAYGEAVAVVDEAETLTAGEKYSVREFTKILRSGFTAAQVSLIPPKQDAVFVGDLSKCVNAGSKVLIVGGLTGAVPSASADTAILTDGELASLEKLMLAVSPKISQVNLRIKETTALNLCAFSQRLYLVYPVRSGGEELGASEVIDYAKRLFTVGGAQPEVKATSFICGEGEFFPYYNCRPAPAVRKIANYIADPLCDSPEKVSAVAACFRGYMGGDDGVCQPAVRDSVADMHALYGGDVSPTDLETYYTCPYLAFAQRGLRLSQRREGVFRPLDSGNFIHEVLRQTALAMPTFKDKEQCCGFAKSTAERLLSTSTYAVPEEDGGAAYAAKSLIEEAGIVAGAVYEQIYNSDFRVESVETVCRSTVGGVNLNGRIDRTDVCGDLVRVIDYKTGTVKAEAEAYYMGLKLQLPLYLSAVAEGRRPAGAYYFPANLDYTDGTAGAFTMQGFMDGGEEVVRHSDKLVEEKKQSAYVGAYLNGRKTDRAMSGEDFGYFLRYASRLFEEGGKEMLSGEVSPSPVEGSCAKCAYRGLCGYDPEAGGEREMKKANCAAIADIIRREEEGEDKV